MKYPVSNKPIGNASYRCMECGADLVFISTDILDVGSRTEYRCRNANCYTGYYEVGGELIHNADNRPQLDCPYCNQECEYISFKDDWADHWKCNHCQVQIDKNPFEEEKVYTLFYKHNDRQFALRLFWQSKTSRIDYIPKDPEDTMVVVAYFDFLLDNVTPQNIHTKLPTYVIFS